MTTKPAPSPHLLQDDLHAPVGAGLLAQVRAGLPGMTRANAGIARYLLAAPEEFMQVPINMIADRAAVSQPSVMRFCRSFGYKGIADFRIALAMNLAQSDGADTGLIEPTVADKAVMNLPQKEAIALAALQHLGTAQSILLDGGSTMQVFAQKLRQAMPLTIMTTGLNVAEVLHGASQHRLMLPGGILRPESRSLVGDLVEHSLAQLRFDILFLGADAIDPEFGLSTYNEVEARQNGKMIDVSSRVVVLADSKKFGAPRLHRCCALAQVDLVITDAGLPDHVFGDLMRHGTAVVRAPLPQEGV